MVMMNYHYVKFDVFDTQQCIEYVAWQRFQIEIRHSCAIWNWWTLRVNFISLKFGRTTNFYYTDTFLTRFLLLAIVFREQWFSLRNCIPNNLTNPRNLHGTIIVNDICIIVLNITKYFRCLIRELLNCVYKSL